MLERQVKVGIWLLMIASLVGGMIMGYGWGARDHSKLPDCQEDEYLYPEDFTGENEVADLICVHVDKIKDN